MSCVRFLVCLPVLVMLAVTDYKTHRIPKKYWIYLLVVGVGFQMLEGESMGRLFLDGMAVGFPLYMMFVMTKGKMLGGGDVKLMAAAGVLLGASSGYVALLIGLCMALIVQLPSYQRRKVFALGPYLSVGISICLLMN